MVTILPAGSELRMNCLEQVLWAWQRFVLSLSGVALALAHAPGNVIAEEQQRESKIKERTHGAIRRRVYGVSELCAVL